MMTMIVRRSFFGYLCRLVGTDGDCGVITIVGADMFCPYAIGAWYVFSDKKQ